MLRATYSPEDNKLRLSSLTRLDTETYTRVKAAGFSWAPKQEIFVAPAWSPSREDLLIELCGEIEDEDTSLVDRAEQRAERFEDYSEKRAEDAERAREAVSAIADNIPLGQPILVGHHSEKHARKDAEKIENGMRRAVKMWETSEYWKRRAAGAIRHAKYKELPAVRARRIKGLETDKRREEKHLSRAQTFIKLWERPELTPQRALAISGADWISRCFPVADYPRPEGASKYEGEMSLYSALKDGIITGEQAREIALPIHRGRIANANRWISHLENRLEYEKAMLEEAGASDLLKPKPKPKQLPLCNYRAPGGLQVENIYHRGETLYYPQIEMTQEEYARIPNDYKCTRVVGHSHRVRTAMRNHSLVCVFLTDSKTHDIPAEQAAPIREPRFPVTLTTPAPKSEPTAFDAMRETLKAGVKVVSAPQLFPTPPELAARMAELAEIPICEPSLRILEPSAGTGAIIDAIFTYAGSIVAVELNASLASALSQRFRAVNVKCADFLECNGDLGKFDRVLMNPPFANAQDIKHITHALHFLKPGGRLVAICANGPRQNETLKPLVEEFGGTWEVLPPDTFKESGTGVNTVLLSVALAKNVHVE